nr:hypothetical transcript [Hymenolepis microstoma]
MSQETNNRIEKYAYLSAKLWNCIYIVIFVSGIIMSICSTIQLILHMNTGIYCSLLGLGIVAMIVPVLLISGVQKDNSAAQLTVSTSISSIYSLKFFVLIIVVPIPEILLGILVITYLEQAIVGAIIVASGGFAVVMILLHFLLYMWIRLFVGSK